MEEALQVGEVGHDNQAKEAEGGELAAQLLQQGVEAQMGMLRKMTPVQHGQRTDPQVQLQTGKAGRKKKKSMLGHNPKNKAHFTKHCDI